mgnify:CR=1 FL=1
MWGMEAVVFDMDGTLTDTEATWDVVRHSLAAEDGVPWPEGSTQAMMGMSTQEWSAHLVEVVGLRGTPEDAARRTIEGLQEIYRTNLNVLPGAREAVERMASRWTLGLASSSPRVLIDQSAATMGIADLFATTMSTEELSDAAGKPAPDVYLEVCRRLGADPARSVAVEDSTNGLLSAHAAGMKVVAIPPHFHPPAAEVLALADVVIDSLDELTIDLVAGLLER